MLRRAIANSLTANYDNSAARALLTSRDLVAAIVGRPTRRRGIAPGWLQEGYISRNHDGRPYSATTSKSAPPPLSSKSEEKAPLGGVRRWFIPDNYLLRSMGLAALTATALTGAYTGLRQAKVDEAQRERARQDAGSSFGTADIGGPFTLTNVSTGRRFTEGDLRGKFALVYFGFTTCPDVCPAELEKMRLALNALEKKRGIGAADITPVFITVDPERDTAKAISDYLKPFHPRLVGLTGTRAQVDVVTKAYKVYAKRTSDDANNYLVDHSIIMYLMSPEGTFLDFYGKHVSEAELEDSIAAGMGEWRERRAKAVRKNA